MHIPLTEVILRHDGAELARVTLPPGEYVIGRNPDVPIHADTPLISRRHAQVTINYDHLLIEDLGSSNGTFVNEQPIVEATRLFPNQPVRLGPDITVEIRRQRAPSAPGVSLAPAQETLRRFLPEELLGDKRYAIGGVVAQGGMGAILGARQTAIERTVAMKVMLGSSGEAAVLRFLDEAKITGQLEHPNIVPVHELGVDENDQLFYTMKMVRGITLKKVLELIAEGVAATVRKYPLPVLLTIFQKVCDALAFAHSKGVIHRDLKPENIMLDDFGVVLVMDWGLAKVIGATHSRAENIAVSVIRSTVISARGAEPQLGSTHAGTIMGTPQYMSPEQARGEVETLDPRTDIYALGAILYTMLALHPPVSGADLDEVIDKVVRGEIEPLGSASTTHLPGNRVPDSLTAVVRKAMALDREQRYPSVEDLQRDLAAYQGGFATSAEKASTARQLILLVKRHKALAGTAAAAWLIITALAVSFVFKITEERNVANDERDRANTSLGQLRATAPTFAEQARLLTAQERLPEALEKIAVALTLNPSEASFHAERGNILQTMESFNEAADEYAVAAWLNPSFSNAQTNVTLSRLLATARDKNETLPLDTRTRWRDALTAQGRTAEALLAARGTSFDAKKMLPVWQAKLDAWLGKNAPRLSVDSSGFYALDLTELSLTDLSPLRGMPVSNLNVARNPHLRDLGPLADCPLHIFGVDSPDLTDLSPLRGKNLDAISISGTGVSDLSPLAGMGRLRELNIQHTAVDDLSPVRDARLARLTAYNSRIRSLEPLRGQPLDTLRLSSTPITSLAPIGDAPIKILEIANCGPLDLAELHTRSLRQLFAKNMILDHLEVLAETTELEVITIPRNMTDPSILRNLPRLRKIDTEGSLTEIEKMKDATDFWRDFDARQAARKQ